MARGIFQLLIQHDAVLFASAIPRGSKRNAEPAVDYLRKDQVFLFERYFYFLEGKREHGVIVADQVELTANRRFVRQLHAYFTKTATGRQRTAWIVPAPMFVDSDMIYPIQAADLCIYCVNWGFRLPSQGMDAAVREEIESEFAPMLRQLQFNGSGYRDGQVFSSYGICYVPNPFGQGREAERP